MANKLKRKIAYAFKKGEDIYLSTNDILDKFTYELCAFEDKDACFSDKTKITILIEEVSKARKSKHTIPPKHKCLGILANFI